MEGCECGFGITLGAALADGCDTGAETDELGEASGRDEGVDTAWLDVCVDASGGEARSLRVVAQ